jgi:site-specific recombinase XerD
MLVDMINISKVEEFKTWLKRRGRTDDTIDLYVDEVTKAATLPGGFFDRIGDRELAPKTRHRIRTSALSWSRFLQDTTLERELREFKLPRARRAKAKTPITHEEQLAIVDEIDRADYLESSMRAVLGMIACRGFRVGDVLRLRRDEVTAACDFGVLAFEAKGEARLEFRLLSTFERHVQALAHTEGTWTKIEELIARRAKKEKRTKTARRAVARALTKVAMRCKIFGMHPHRLRRTYAVEYLKQLKGDPDALMKLKQHMQWDALATAAEYVDHARGIELDGAAERIFRRDGAERKVP